MSWRTVLPAYRTPWTTWITILPGRSISKTVWIPSICSSASMVRIFLRSWPSWKRPRPSWTTSPSRRRSWPSWSRSAAGSLPGAMTWHGSFPQTGKRPRRSLQPRFRKSCSSWICRQCGSFRCSGKRRCPPWEWTTLSCRSAPMWAKSPSRWQRSLPAVSCPGSCWR